MPVDKYVLRISKPGLGKNVEDCSDDELVFNSEREVLKVPLNGVGSSYGGTTVNHNLGYIPIFTACRKDTGRVDVMGSYNGVIATSSQLIFPSWMGYYFKYYLFYKQGA